MAHILKCDRARITEIIIITAIIINVKKNGVC